jgi:hypothetical protein
MRKMNITLSSVLAVVLVGVLLGGVSTPVAAAEPVEQQTLVDKARITFQVFMRDQNMTW